MRLSLRYRLLLPLALLLLGDAAATKVAAARRAQLETLIKELESELEWIPLMAMRKERDRRYNSPLQLADDIRYYLQGRPLLAGPIRRRSAEKHDQRLPDFDEIEVEKKALDHAQRSPNVLQALCFLVGWPALDRAATLVLERAAEFDGDHYEILTPAAEALAGKHPLAATMLLRAMINFSLKNSRSSRYRHACSIAPACHQRSRITAASSRTGAYEAKLRLEHGRKSSFWSLV